jgi:cytidylate kinase
MDALSESIVVAIDGPAASGKSSVAQSLARRIGLIYVNTGAMYRAFTWHTLAHGADPMVPAEVIALLDRTDFQCGVLDRRSTMLLDGVDPEPHLVEPSVTSSVSQVATIPEVRRRLVALQREYGAVGDVVMEGRDIGSAVFPETPYKFYIDASVEVRAQRRARQGLADSIQMRDKVDSSRRTSPLIIAEDAHVIDSSNLTIDGVVGEIIGRLKMRGLEFEKGVCSLIRRPAHR